MSETIKDLWQMVEELMERKAELERQNELLRMLGRRASIALPYAYETDRADKAEAFGLLAEALQAAIDGGALDKDGEK